MCIYIYMYMYICIRIYAYTENMHVISLLLVHGSPRDGARAMPTKDSIFMAATMRKPFGFQASGLRFKV